MLLYNWFQIKNSRSRLSSANSKRSNPVTSISHIPRFQGGKKRKPGVEKGRRLSPPFVFYFNACARRVTWRVISTLKSTPLFGPLNYCLFITCIRIRFDGQFREWASTRRCEPLLTSGSWKGVTGYTCGLQVSVLSSFQKLQRSLTLTALESTYELVTSLLGWNLSGFNWWHFHSKMVL